MHNITTFTLSELFGVMCAGALESGCPYCGHENFSGFPPAPLNEQGWQQQVDFHEEDCTWLQTRGFSGEDETSSTDR